MELTLGRLALNLIVVSLPLIQPNVGQNHQVFILDHPEWHPPMVLQSLTSEYITITYMIKNI
jgi:hypothetical protein